MNKKVLVAMSGGVDSSVAAYLLKKEGYDVAGATFSLFDANEYGVNSNAINDAKKVADFLGIKHFVFDMRELFSNKVVSYFVEEYINGRTPNPCVKCNKHIKFGDFLEKAKELGYDLIATGHYARVKYNENSNRYILLKAVSKKDQSYFLYNLTQKQLEKILFPLGELSKDEVRCIAKENGIPVHNKPDSQEICFIKDNDYCSFLETKIKPLIRKGNFIDMEGNILGEHKGIYNYTIGQRKGLGLALGRQVYVVKIDAESNNVTLGNKEELMSSGLIASDVNIISGNELSQAELLTAKVRYSAKETGVDIIPVEKGFIKVIFEEKQRAVTPGQSVVFYRGEEVIGGGIIYCAL